MIKQRDSEITIHIDQVISKDGTLIGYRRLGNGPSLLLLHGSGMASQHYLPLARLLADRYTVYIPDRRGRGLSGHHRDNHSISVELEDFGSLFEKVSADLVFGHSAGGVIALEAALVYPIRKLAIYEPAISIHGSMPTSWLPSFENAISHGDNVQAMVIFLKGMDMNWVGNLPNWLLELFVRILFRSSEGKDASNLLPTIIPEIHMSEPLDSTFNRYNKITAATLLLGGSSSPSYIREPLRTLANTIPQARLIEFPKFDHSSPASLGEEPQRFAIAKELIRFFT
jgi:pimeloyl-ACP methyl ester carboxylesterase